MTENEKDLANIAGLEMRKGTRNKGKPVVAGIWERHGCGLSPRISRRDTALMTP